MHSKRVPLSLSALSLQNSLLVGAHLALVSNAMFDTRNYFGALEALRIPSGFPVPGPAVFDRLQAVKILSFPSLKRLTKL
jgi:hypothetical protein